MSEQIYFTSDNHFGHKRIFEFCPNTRRGSDIDEMDELMIQEWNKMVGKNSRIFCLGDFSFRKAPETERILRRLNGQKHLIIGNHDYWMNDDTKKYWTSIQHYKELKVNGIQLILFHFPIQEWHKAHYGYYHLYGHVHGSLQVNGRAMDVGIDARSDNTMRPFTFDEIHEKLKEKEVIKHHNKVMAGQTL
jgi:calcineurin-like phosphoesterase family protein